ncbi:UDP-4-amino-4,6-dideoxy-N-acetyl-beta-L-altrosamine N-acetyltransferase [Fibrella sp. WM1]|uniref:UDP-4-amino-4, 6-dideoxy-N-acetyl-beta-L-altrosamine N-acetyltransferase n=1 Tax=Fibrella musci TaxID=3242485 RepID=UPI003520E4EE
MDVILREMAQEDIELVRSWRNQPEVSKYMYTDGYISEEQQQKWFDAMHSDHTNKYWMINYNGTDIGVASLYGISQVLSSCYWAFYLGDTTNQGVGIGSKIEFNVLDYVFNTLKLNKLRCEVIVFNEKVTSMHEKFGFRREAYYRQHVKKDGRWQDVVGLAMLREEWKNYREVMRTKIYR